MVTKAPLMEVAPRGVPSAYDRRHLALYAALIDAHDAGTDWREVASDLMLIDPDQDGAELCWRSHLERARWIVGDGLEQSIQTFDADAL